MVRFYLEKFFMYSIFVFFLSISLLGNADKLFFGGIPFRKIAFLVFFSSVLFFILHKKIKLGVLICTIFFIIFGFFFAGLVPMVRGLSIADAIAQVLPYTIPFLAIFITSFVDDKISKTCNSFFSKMIFFVGIMHCVASFSYFFSDEIGNSIYVILSIYLNDVETTDDMVPDFSGSILVTRIQFGISVFLVLYFYFKIKNLILFNSRLNKIKLFVSFIFILITQSRALIFSVILIPALYYLYIALQPVFKNLYSRAVLFVMTLFTPTVLTYLIVRFDPLKTIGLTREYGEDLRFLQQESLLNGLSDNVFFGISMGAPADIVRSVNMPWIYELSIIAFIAQIGFLGLALLFLMLCFFAYYLSTAKSNYYTKFVINYKENALALSAIFSFVLASNTNPYLNNFIGGFILLVFFIEYGRSYIFLK